MSMFTTDIATILRKTAQDLEAKGITSNLDVSTMEGARNTARAAFFSTNGAVDGDYRPEVKMINEAYRDYFCTAFPLHYMFDEIGMETVPAWKMALMSKIVDNAAYINTIMEHLDKQAMSSFRIKKVDNSVDRTSLSTLNENSKLDGTNERNDVKSGSNSEYFHEVTENDHNENGMSNVADSNSSMTNNKELNMNNEVSTGNRSNVETNANTETGSRVDTGFESSNNQQTSVSNTTTTDNSTDESNTSNHETTNSDNMTNSMSGTLDTPQGAISNMRNPDIDLAGLGISAIKGSQYKYLTAAATTDATTVQDSTSSNNETSNSEHDGVSVTDGNTTDNSVLSRNTSSDTVDEKTNSGIKNSVDEVEDVKASSGSNVVEGAVTDTSLRQTQDTNNVNDQGFTDHNRINSDSSVQNTVDNIDHTDMKSSSGSNVGSEIAAMSEDEKLYSMEFLAASEPFMTKIWKIFDPIFMQIIDVF